jgi:hypothetical protein
MTGSRVIGFYLVGSPATDGERAELILDGLAKRRPVFGEAGEWRVFYEAEGTSEALRMCEADLGELDPLWPRILDFKALPQR